LVGSSRAVRVFQYVYFVIRHLTGLPLRIRFGCGAPEPALGVPVHLDRLLKHRIAGEKVDLPSVGQLERLALQLRIGIGIRLAIGRQGQRCRTEGDDRYDADQNRRAGAVVHFNSRTVSAELPGEAINELTSLPDSRSQTCTCP